MNRGSGVARPPASCRMRLERTCETMGVSSVRKAKSLVVRRVNGCGRNGSAGSGRTNGQEHEIRAVKAPRNRFGRTITSACPSQQKPLYRKHNARKWVYSGRLA